MLFRLVRPVRRKGTRNHQFVRRIPRDVRDRAAGKTLHVPVGAQTIPLTISDKADSVRLSLRTDDPSEVKRRTAEIDAYLETAWKALRAPGPISLTHKQATALAGELYRSWADADRGRSISVEHIEGRGFVVVDEWSEEEETQGWRCSPRTQGERRLFTPWRGDIEGAGVNRLELRQLYGHADDLPFCPAARPPLSPSSSAGACIGPR